jgi:glycosyltransferase involved in cell wall biosynthesis
VSQATPAEHHVVVDMTPLGSGGQNGGAGLVATTLVHHLSKLAPELALTLLTSDASHAELASLDASNVRRQCVTSSPSSRSLARGVANKLLPTQARERLRTVWSLTKSRRYATVVGQLRPDLLLCPFTIPYFWQPGVPCVSIVYDLQHLAYPDFFTAEQRVSRQRHVAEAYARSARVVCISEYVRGTLLASLKASPERVATIPLGVLQNLASPDRAVIDRLGLRGAKFLLYPANYWPNKNHPQLFEALSLYSRSHPVSQLRLVLTGFPNALMRSLEKTANSLALSDAIIFAGYVRSEELAALLDSCVGLVFPSLYEGFGMPVLEAMARNRPVLCSNVTSLPEVAGDAAIYFDPANPAEIAAAIDALADPVRVADLVRRGRARAAQFGDGATMAAKYLAVLQGVLDVT